MAHWGAAGKNREPVGPYRDLQPWGLHGLPLRVRKDMSNFRFVFTSIESFLNRADPNWKNYRATLGSIRSYLPVANKKWRADILRCTVGTVTIKLRDSLNAASSSDDSGSENDSQDEGRSENRKAVARGEDMMMGDDTDYLATSEHTGSVGRECIKLTPGGRFKKNQVNNS